MGSRPKLPRAHLERKQVSQAFQSEEPPVDVVPEKQELAGGEVHPQLPDVIREEVQILRAKTGFMMLVLLIWIGGLPPSPIAMSMKGLSRRHNESDRLVVFSSSRFGWRACHSNKHLPYAD